MLGLSDQQQQNLIIVLLVILIGLSIYAVMNQSSIASNMAKCKSETYENVFNSCTAIGPDGRPVRLANDAHCVDNPNTVVETDESQEMVEYPSMQHNDTLYPRPDTCGIDRYHDFTIKHNTKNFYESRVKPPFDWHDIPSSDCVRPYDDSDGLYAPCLFCGNMSNGDGECETCA